MATDTLPDVNPENRIIDLPHETTADELRAVIQCLKKKPDGIFVGGDSEEFFGPSGSAMYETLGIVVRSGDVVRLSPLGWEMARRLEPAAAVFRALIAHHERYRAALEWAFRQGTAALTAESVADFWLRQFPEEIGGSAERVADGAVECFFGLCQAAALGSVTTGRGRHPSRLRLDREELAGFLAPQAYPQLVTISGEQTPIIRNDPDSLPSAPEATQKCPPSPGQTLRGQTIALKVLSLAMLEELENIGEERAAGDVRGVDFAGEVRRFETALIKSALRCAGGRQRRAARLLNMTKSTFNAKLKRYNIQSNVDKDGQDRQD